MHEVTKNDIDKSIRIYNELWVYGPAANEAIANRLEGDLNSNWNIEDAHIQIDNERYSVVFSFKVHYAKFLDPTEVLQNPYPWKKYFKIVYDNPINISFVDGIKSNTGEFLLKNIEKPDSKTAPHEIGHCWGLLHPTDTDFRGKGQPHIMYPRGTFVDPEFRYKPEAELIQTPEGWLMQEGFTVDTQKRKVTQQNIDDLGLESLEYDHLGNATLSGLSNRFHGLE